jgi:hypothetical protein
MFLILRIPGLITCTVEGEKNPCLATLYSVWVERRWRWSQYVPRQVLTCAVSSTVIGVGGSGQQRQPGVLPHLLALARPQLCAASLCPSPLWFLVFIREPLRKHFLPSQFSYAAHILSEGGDKARDSRDCNTAKSRHAQAGLRRQKTQTSLIMCASSRSNRQRHGINHLRSAWTSTQSRTHTGQKTGENDDFKVILLNTPLF